MWAACQGLKSTIGMELGPCLQKKGLLEIPQCFPELCQKYSNYVNIFNSMTSMNICGPASSGTGSISVKNKKILF